MTGMNRASLGRWIAGLAFAATVLGLVEAQFHLLRKVCGAGPLTQRELAMEYLGRYLASQCPGKKAVVLANPFSQKSGQPRDVYRFEKAGLQGLQRGLGKSVVIETVAFPELKAGFVENPRSVFIDPRTTTPLSYVVTDDALDKIAEAHPQAELLVSLIGFPLNVRQTEIWKSGNPRQFALLLPDLRMVGDEGAVREAILSGKIAAFVMNKPGAPAEDQPLGKDSKMEFDRRFLLVNCDTVDRLLQLYPRLFR
jgi:hypothetical protein